MTLSELLAKVTSDRRDFQFQEVMAAIDGAYQFTPTAFVNGEVNNGADQNQGSCKVFAFAKLKGLSEAETLRLFAEHYQHVLAEPDGDAHQNIRAFMHKGWGGIEFSGQPLLEKD